MKQVVSTLDNFTYSTIPDLYPTYNPYFSYKTEFDLETPTYESVVRVGNYLYRSTSEDNKGNHPLDEGNLGVFWILWGVANRFAMLDHTGDTKTIFDGDGEVQFLRAGITSLIIGLITGCGSVEVSSYSNSGNSELKMTELGDMPSANFDIPNAMAINGDTVFVVDSFTDKLISVDISNPSNMAELSALSSANFSSPSSIAISGSTAFITDIVSDKLVAVDATNPSSMVELSAFSSLNMTNAEAVAISGNTAFVVDSSTSKLIAVDITNPSAMVELSALTSANFGSPYRITISGNTAFIGDYGTSKLIAVDITNPSAMVELSALSSANFGTPSSIAISGNTAFVTDYFTDKLIAIDITSPNSMVELSALSSANFGAPYSVAINGSIAFVAEASNNKLIAVDISNPSVMVELSALSSANFGSLRAVVISDGIAFTIVQGNANLISVDIDTYSLIDNQIENLYSKQVGAVKFDLPEQGDLVKVNFYGANGSSVEVGTLLAGEAVEMGDTLTDVSFKRVRGSTQYYREANFDTIVDKEDYTQTLLTADETIEEDAGFIIDDNSESIYQSLLYAGKLLDNTSSANNNSKQKIRWKIEGDALISGGELGESIRPHFKMNLEKDLEISVGRGEATFTRTTTATYIDRYGVLKYAAIDEPRFEKDGLLIEGASTNVLTYSNDFTQWAGSSYITANYADSPDGTVNSSRVLFTAENQIVSTAHGLVNGTTVSGSYYLKGVVGETILLNVGADDFVHTFSGEWERVKKENVVISVSLFLVSTYGGATARDFLMAFTQLEELPFASSYIPTTTAAATRGADNCLIDSYNNHQRITAGNPFSIILDINIFGATPHFDYRHIYSLGFGESGVDRYSLLRLNQNSNIANYYRSASSINISELTENMKRISITVDADETVSTYADGLLIGTTTASLNLSGEFSPTIYLGSHIGGAYGLFGHIANFRSYDKALTATKIALT